MMIKRVEQWSLSELLGYAGLIPFILLGGLTWFGVDGAGNLFKLYSLTILAFMAGGCWGVEQANPDKIDSTLLALSIGAFLWGLMAYFLPLNVSVVMLLAAFILLLWIESNPLFKQSYQASYKKLRLILTTVVGVMHVVVFVASNY